MRGGISESVTQMRDLTRVLGKASGTAAGAPSDNKPRLLSGNVSSVGVPRTARRGSSRSNVVDRLALALAFAQVNPDE